MFSQTSYTIPDQGTPTLYKAACLYFFAMLRKGVMGEAKLFACAGSEKPIGVLTRSRADVQIPQGGLNDDAYIF